MKRRVDHLVVRAYVGCTCTGDDCTCDADWTRYENDDAYRQAIIEEASA